MLSLEVVTALCARIGQELGDEELSRYDLIDRVTALILLAGRVQRLMEEGYAVEGHSIPRSTGDRERVTGELAAASSALYHAADGAHTVSREELRDTLIAAQRRLAAACVLFGEL